MFVCERDKRQIATFCCMCSFTLPCFCEECKEWHSSKPGFHYPLPLHARKEIASAEHLKATQQILKRLISTRQQLQSILSSFAQAKTVLNSTYEGILQQITEMRDTQLAQLNKDAASFALRLNNVEQEIPHSAWKADLPASQDPLAGLIWAHNSEEAIDCDIKFKVETGEGGVGTAVACLSFESCTGLWGYSGCGCAVH